jgi:hypothetical protein
VASASCPSPTEPVSLSEEQGTIQELPGALIRLLVQIQCCGMSLTVSLSNKVSDGAVDPGPGPYFW